jgi:hypothetical protein
MALPSSLERHNCQVGVPPSSAHPRKLPKRKNVPAKARKATAEKYVDRFCKHDTMTQRALK